MAAFRRITDRFSAAPQLEAADFARAAAAGFSTVIANRPDGEEPGQLSLAEAESLAREAGLSFVAIPFRLPATEDVLARTARALAEAPGPVLGYCRTGTRSTTAWALATAGAGMMAVDDILGAAAGGGYDLTPLRSALEDRARAA